MTIREQQEALEHEILSPRATFADETRGRERPEEECPMRTPFQWIETGSCTAMPSGG